MNWSKAKNVLILIFLALNIFLFTNLIFQKFDSGISVTTINNTRIALEKQREIAVKCEIPKDDVANVILNYELYDSVRNSVIKAFVGNVKITENLHRGNSYEFDGIKIEVRNDGVTIISLVGKNKMTEITNEKDIKSYFADKLKNTEIPVKDYIIDHYEKSVDGNLKVCFIHNYKDFLVYDNYVAFEETKEGQWRLEFNYKKIQGIKRDKTSDIKVKPAYQILLNNYTKGKVKAIEAIDAGFKCNINDTNSKLIQQSPVWRVKTDGGNVDYYNAYTGNKLN